MASKNYRQWSVVKAAIHTSRSHPVGFREREVWVCSLGENIGFEQDGKGSVFARPVLILKVFSKQFCFVIPLSTTDRRGHYYFPFDAKTGRLSVAVLSQAKAIDSRRLHIKIGVIGQKDFVILKTRLIRVLSLK